MMVSGLFGIVLNAGLAGELELASPEDAVEIGSLPWEQSVQGDDYIGGAWQGILAKGNVSRTWSFTRRAKYTDNATMYADLLDADAFWTAGEEHTLSILVYENYGTAFVSTTQWDFPVAVLKSVTPKADPEAMSIDFAYTFQVGPLARSA